MKTVFQTSESNPYFSTKGNGQFRNVTRSGWKLSRLGEKKKKVIIDALKNTDVDKVYKRNNKIYALFLNGAEKVIA